MLPRPILLDKILVREEKLRNVEDNIRTTQKKIDAKMEEVHELFDELIGLVQSASATLLETSQALGKEEK